jgi:hypothetical protein
MYFEFIHMQYIVLIAYTDLNMHGDAAEIRLYSENVDWVIWKVLFLYTVIEQSSQEHARCLCVYSVMQVIILVKGYCPTGSL